MKKLSLAALALLVVSQTTGCIITSDDEDVGYFDVGWTVTLGGAPSTCEANGITAVRVRSVPFLGGEYFDLFDCAPMHGVTSALPLDTYTVAAQASDCPSGSPESCLLDPAHILSDWVPISATLDMPGETVSVDVEFAVAGAATVDFMFQVDFGTQGGNNCATGGAQDSGVVQQKVTIYGEGASQCTEYTIEGTDQESAAFSFGSCGEAALCMETTVEHYIYDMPAGNYTFTIEGLKGAVGATTYTCYSAEFANFDVTGTAPLFIVPYLSGAPSECEMTKL